MSTWAPGLLHHLLQLHEPVWRWGQPAAIGENPDLTLTEVERLVRPGGLFVFHLNALEDRPLRARWQPARELELDYVVEESGQTVHFFSEAYLRDLPQWMAGAGPEPGADPASPDR
jgi:hypothetical protein